MFILAYFVISIKVRFKTDINFNYVQKNIFGKINLLSRISL